MKSDPMGSVVKSDPMGSVVKSDPMGSVAKSDPMGSVAKSDPMGSVVKPDPMGSVVTAIPVDSALKKDSVGFSANNSSWHVCVLIPARNEEQLLPRCLRSVLLAASKLPAFITYDLVVAVDSSTDQTLDIAELMLQGQGTVVATQEGVVGCARALAAQAALDRYDGPLSRCWLANTDADCVVPPDWLNQHLSLACNQVEAVAGTVDVDTFEEHEAVVEERFRTTYLLRPDGSHPHVHGANLGVRADVYLRAGGWSNFATAEDHDLWNRLTHIGARTCSTSTITVSTSGRRVGRAPHGFADALAAHNETAA